MINREKGQLMTTPDFERAYDRLNFRLRCIAKAFNLYAETDPRFRKLKAERFCRLDKMLNPRDFIEKELKKMLPLKGDKP